MKREEREIHLKNEILILLMHKKCGSVEDVKSFHKFHFIHNSDEQWKM